MVYHNRESGWQLDGQSPAWFLSDQPEKSIPVKSAPEYPAVCLDTYKTFYFDFEAGLDDNDGLSPETPKQTLNEASILTAKYGGEGLRLLFKAGSTFYGNLILGGFAAQDDRPLIVDRYPEEADTFPKLIGGGDIIRVKTGNVRIYHLEITGKYAYRGIFCAPDK